MAINILLSTMGYLFVAHFCAGEMKSASMIVNTTSSCCGADEKLFNYLCLFMFAVYKNQRAN
jgi:hypothetical protein